MMASASATTKSLAARYPGRVLGSLALLAGTALWSWRALAWQDVLVLEDHFSVSDRIRSFMLRAQGERLPDGRLGVAAGERAVRAYRLARTSSQRMRLSIRGVPDARVRLEASLVFRNQETELEPELFDGRWFDVTALTNPAHTLLELRMSNEAPPGTAPVAALEGFAVERRGSPLPLSLASFFFFVVAGAFFWFHLLILVLPAIVARLRTERQSLSPRGRLAWAFGLLALTSLYGHVAADPAWRTTKDYDDRAAISNGATLLDSAYQTYFLFFRSRVRPAFPALIQPILALRPHRMASYWLNPSDFYRQAWFIHDEDGAQFGLYVYPTMTLLGLLMALAIGVVLYDLYRQLGLAPWVALVSTALALVFFRRSLAVVITQSASLLASLLAAWAFLKWGRAERLGVRLGAGLVLGWALLIKETAATTALAVGFFTLIDGPWAELPRRLRRLAPYVAGSLLFPLWYFGFAADGGFAEIAGQFRDHLAQQELNQFQPLTLQSGLRDGWSVFSWGLPAAIVGLVLAARRRLALPGERFLLCWTLGCLPVFALPYIFPRFLQYFAPSVAYWVARLLIEGRGESERWSARSGQGFEADASVR